MCGALGGHGDGSGNLLWWYRIVPHRSYVKGCKISPKPAPQPGPGNGLARAGDFTQLRADRGRQLRAKDGDKAATRSSNRRAFYKHGEGRGHEAVSAGPLCDWHIAA